MKIHKYLVNAVKGHPDLGYSASEIDDSLLLEIDSETGTLPDTDYTFEYDGNEKFLSILNADGEPIQLSIIFKNEQEGKKAIRRLQEIAESCEIQPNLPDHIETPGVATLISTAITYDDEENLRKSQYFTSWFAASVIKQEAS